MRVQVIYTNGGRLRRMVETEQMILFKNLLGQEAQVVAAEEQVVTIILI